MSEMIPRSYSGTDSDKVDKIEVSVNGAAAAAPDTPFTSDPPKVGESAIVQHDDGKANTHLVVIATFTDGTEQIILDTTMVNPNEA
ncbi:MAG: hypothetical protein GXY82_01725 [Methanospirillum sp.]|nr:hypothetical protein [Methanospirillum sp.]